MGESFRDSKALSFFRKDFGFPKKNSSQLVGKYKTLLVFYEDSSARVAKVQRESSNRKLPPKYPMEVESSPPGVVKSFRKRVFDGNSIRSPPSK